MATPLTGRDDFTAGQTTILKDGGTFGAWVIKVDANQKDIDSETWGKDPVIKDFSFANIPTDGAAWNDPITGEANFQEKTLLQLSSIDRGIDILKNQLEVIGDVQFTIENLTGFYDTQRAAGITFKGMASC